MDINKLIEDVIDRYWNWRLLDIPEFATFVGEHRYDDRLMDMSCLLYTSPSPRDATLSRMPSSA